MSAADRALEAIDAGLQHSTEAGMLLEPEGKCWRCTFRPVAEDSDLCSPCRAFLLEDLELDPKLTLTVEEAEALAAFVNELVAALRPILEAIVDVAVKLLEGFGPALRSMFGDSARDELETRSLVPPGRLPPVGTRRLPSIPMRDLRTTEAPRSAPSPRRRTRP